MTRKPHIYKTHGYWAVECDPDPPVGVWGTANRRIHSLNKDFKMACRQASMLHTRKYVLSRTHITTKEAL